MSDTIIWITGATDGIGAELAKQAPYPGARIINLSRRKHPDYESVHLDLTDPVGLYQRARLQHRRQDGPRPDRSTLGSGEHLR